MNDDNFENSLSAFLRRRPFKSFAVELVSGDRFIVDHPEALALRGAVAVFINPRGEYTLFDATTVSQLTDTTERASA
ncbi:MAG: hypothetical protein L0Y71_06820 [Gemmataceae bacterium]|nr:hypothetical protein [Gemmataceae bacterium]